MSQKTWGGRFTTGTDSRVEAFTESISFDRRLYRHDIVGSQAHACMLAEVGLLTAGEAEQIVAALRRLQYAVAGEIEHLRIVRREKIRRVPVEAQRQLTR